MFYVNNTLCVFVYGPTKPIKILDYMILRNKILAESYIYIYIYILYNCCTSLLSLTFIGTILIATKHNTIGRNELFSSSSGLKNTSYSFLIQKEKFPKRCVVSCFVTVENVLTKRK